MNKENKFTVYEQIANKLCNNQNPENTLEVLKRFQGLEEGRSNNNSLGSKYARNIYFGKNSKRKINSTLYQKISFDKRLSRFGGLHIHTTAYKYAARDSLVTEKQSFK